MAVPVLETPIMTVADSFAMRMLADGIPLTLLLDLAEQFGPPSVDILRAEGTDCSWLVPPTPLPAPRNAR
ncbi:MAG: hypothetical protein ACYDB7_07045 [Mycobacteriales bacterium]